jgi:hypothetical protein
MPSIASRPPFGVARTASVKPPDAVCHGRAGEGFMPR